MTRLKSWLRRVLGRHTYYPVPGLPRIAGRIDVHIPEVIAAVRAFTMTSPQRIAALCRAVEDVERRRVAGAIVECGVWRGGSMMAAALSLLRLRAAPRDLYLFDTFAGMTEPGPLDRDLDGKLAADLLLEESHYGDAVRAEAGIDETRRNLASTGFPSRHLHFMKGDVGHTLPDAAPAQIALLRLDTDWYDLTRHELIHLYPRLAPGGVLIIDDYGHWQGAKRAVDEYFAEMDRTKTLHAIDYSARLVIK